VPKPGDGTRFVSKEDRAIVQVTGTWCLPTTICSVLRHPFRLDVRGSFERLPCCLAVIENDVELSARDNNNQRRDEAGRVTRPYSESSLSASRTQCQHGKLSESSAQSHSLRSSSMTPASLSRISQSTSSAFHSTPLIDT